jgi:hypothetical protein
MSGSEPMKNGLHLSCLPALTWINWTEITGKDEGRILNIKYW